MEEEKGTQMLVVGEKGTQIFKIKPGKEAAFRKLTGETLIDGYCAHIFQNVINSKIYNDIMDLRAYQKEDLEALYSKAIEEIKKSQTKSPARSSEVRETRKRTLAEISFQDFSDFIEHFYTNYHTNTPQDEVEFFDYGYITDMHHEKSRLLTDALCLALKYHYKFKKFKGKKRYERNNLATALKSFIYLIQKNHAIKAQMVEKDYGDDFESLSTKFVQVGLAIGQIDSLQEFPDPDLLDSLNGLMRSKTRKAGWGPSDKAKEKCVEFAREYWDEGGIMNHIELTSVMVKKPSEYVDLKGIKKNVPEGSIRDAIKDLADEKKRRYGQAGVIKDNFKKQRKPLAEKLRYKIIAMEGDIGIPERDRRVKEEIEKHILNLKLIELRKSIQITKNDAGFVNKEDYTSILMGE